MKKLNILIACEESQVVCAAFRERGHNAYSCDVQECSGGHPEWHILGDVLNVLNPSVHENHYEWFGTFYGIQFTTMDGEEHEFDGRWDLIVAHPPCTYLTIAGNKYFDVEKYGDKAIERARLREEAIDFFMEFVNADCDHIAIENPVGTINTRYRKPDCIVSPHMFGHPVRKKTCFWLKNLPNLEPTNVVEFENIHSKGRTGGYSGPSWYVKDENGKILSWKDPRTAKVRSRTYDGVGKAIAEQWGSYIENENKGE